MLCSLSFLSLSSRSVLLSLSADGLASFLSLSGEAEDEEEEEEEEELEEEEEVRRGGGTSFGY